MAYIKAISTYTPSCVLTNEMLQAQFPKENIGNIAKGIGVSQRHIAAEGQTASDMAYEAARNLFSEYDVSPESIDFIIFATQSPDHFLPSSACILQHRLGVPDTAGAFDFDLGCSGYAYGLAICDSFVKSGLASNVLLLTGDTISKYLHPEDKNRVLFGDAATATLVSDMGGVKLGKLFMVRMEAVPMD